MKYEAIIGLEIHVQLKTKSKMFSPSDNTGENKEPNTTINEIDLGHPGTLPVPNQEAINFGIKAGLALNCEIAKTTKFDRKNYFYPDLPKGYQISQFDEPICKGGYVSLILDERTEKRFNLTRLHLEEDAAKSTHTDDGTLVDYNRAGTPLIEIVTEPDFRSPFEAKMFLQELRTIMRYLGISDADMEKGHLRCDANISLRPVGNDALFPKTEIKNLNSFKAVEKALQYEIKRQTDLWDDDNAPKTSATMGWDEKQGVTIEQRTKEESHDYRYFPEPDIPRINIETDIIEKIKSELPELPIEKRRRFYQNYNLSFDNINQLVLNKDWADYFEQVISELKNWLCSIEDCQKDDEEKAIKLATSWLLNKLPNVLEQTKETFETMNINPENFAELISLIHKGAINNAAALKILEKMIGPNKDQDPSHIMDELGLAQIDNKAEIEDIAKKVLNENADQVQLYMNGKVEVINFLVGQVMKLSKGKANPGVAKEILERLLK